jgi:hypothetical protein
MFIGTQLMGIGNAGSKDYYTPWFPKQADNAIFTYERMFFTGTAFSVTVYTKNREDIGSNSVTSYSSWTQMSGINFWQGQCTNLLELVRFKITLNGSAAGDGVAYRFLPPIWYNKAV